MVLIMKWLTRL